MSSPAIAKRNTNSRSGAAPGMSGSTSISESAFRSSELSCVSLRLGLLMRSIVTKGTHSIAATAVAPHKEREASAVSSNTPTRTELLVVPFLLMTRFESEKGQISSVDMVKDPFC